MARLKTISSNLNAFLDMLAYAEGTSTHPLTTDDGYDVIVTGVGGALEIFKDYSTHPFAKGRKSKQINNKGLTSNASGRYQFMLKDYAHYALLLKLPDFAPDSQDKWAIQLIKERRALPLIEAGKFDEAVAAVSNLWASLPGANYKDQKMRSLDELRKVYLLKGGKLWVSNGSLAPSLQPSVDYSEHGTQQSESVNPKNDQSKLQKMLNGLLSLITNLLKRK